MKLVLITTTIVATLLHLCEASSPVTFPLVPHHVQRQRYLKTGMMQQEDHNVRRRDEALQVGALYHGYGTHYIDLWCGSPPQRQTVIVDTGSGVTAFPCSACSDCGSPEYHIDNYFVESQSSTFSKVPCGQCQKGSCSGGQECRISMSYQEGSSWSAFEATDRCYVGGPHNVPLTEDKGVEDIDPEHASAFSVNLDFGCQTRITGLFKTQLADGIMGMEDASFAFWSQLFKEGKIGSDKQFSLCFSRPLGAERKGTEAGAMTLGGVDPRLHESPMVFATRTNNNGFYNVHVRKIYLRDGVGGESAKSAKPSAKTIYLDVAEKDLNSRKLIVDSGTTDTYFNRVISKAFRAAFKELSGRDFSNTKWALKEEDLAALPTILIQLDGDVDRNKALGNANEVIGLAGILDPEHPYDVILAIPPSHYMEPEGGGKYTPRFYDNENGGSVIGANAMMGHDVLFDIDHSVIGWAQSHCDYYKLLTDNGYTDVLEIGDSQGEESSSSASDDDAGADSDESSSSSSDENTGNSAGDETQQDLDKLANVCYTWSCRGGVTGLFFLLCVSGCFIGSCLCGTSGKKYPKPEVLVSDGTFELDGKVYRDDPVDGEYGEFEMQGTSTVQPIQ